ncbi:breast cancer anti-estrogen resistance protein 3 homolog isoform X2 [Bemisia tabaci]
MTSSPHLEISQWLNILELGKYQKLFDKHQGIESILDYTEADLKQLGVKNATHRARMVASLVALSTKYNENAEEKPRSRVKEKSHRHSVAVDTSRRLNRDDSISDILAVSNVLQSKSLYNIKMEAVNDPLADPAQLKKALEWELSLDNRDLRSHAWYHGAIPRTRAEEIVSDNDGDFLVRDCASQPGNYVLSCRSRGQSLHFVINKVVLQPDTVYERVQYQFEDDAYDTVPDLITYYVGSGKPISVASGAKITTPRNRLFPLSFYATKYNLFQQTAHCQIQSQYPSQNNITGSMNLSTYNSYKSPVHSPPRTRKDTPPCLPFKKQHLTQSLLSADNISNCSLSRQNSLDITDGMKLINLNNSESWNNRFSSQSLPRSKILNPDMSISGILTVPRNGKITRVTSDPALSPCFERKNFFCSDENPGEIPPPKPSRIPSLLHSISKESSNCDNDNISLTDINHANTLKRLSYHTSESDSGNGSGDSVQSSANGDSSESTTPVSTLPLNRPGVVIKNPHYHTKAIPSSCSSTTLKAFDMALDDSSLELENINVDFPSLYDIENFHTLLLPSIENKPLDSTALQVVRGILHETGSRILANHLTRVDMELVLRTYSNSSEDKNYDFGNVSGIELCCLPHGHQLRLDLIERIQCIKLFVAVTILTSTNESERAEALNKWIQVAIDSKTALGNLYGFSSVMLGLCMPQIQRLNTTWHILRQKFTDSAFNFEAKLRPTLKNMNECSNPQAPNTTIPHILPILLLQEKTADEILDDTFSENNNLISTCINSWETSADLGLGTFFAHLEFSRKFGSCAASFKRNSEIVLGDSKIDDLLLDMFRTEFYLKFLWGSRGAAASYGDRHSKFEQVLTVMSEKCEPPTQNCLPSQHVNVNIPIGTSV